MAIIHPTKYCCTVSYSQKYISLYIALYNNYTYSAGMKERCRDGCRTSLLIAGVVLVPAIFHTLLPPCHPYITIHFMEMIFSTCIKIRHKIGMGYESLHIMELLMCTKPTSLRCNPYCHLQCSVILAGVVLKD